MSRSRSFVALPRLAAPTAPLLIVAALIAGSPLRASNISVQGANVQSGANAARLVLASACAAATNHLTVPGPIAAGTYEGCSTLTTAGAIAGGPVTLRAGQSVALQSGFSVPMGAALTVQIDSTIYPDAYLQDDTPDGEIVYAARFYVDAGSLSLAGADRFHHFEALGPADAPQARVGAKWNGGLSEIRLFLEVFLDGGGTASTEGGTELVLPPSGWHWVELGLQAASGPGANDGMAYLCVDSLGGCASLPGLDNDLATVERVRWGGLELPPGAAFGQLDLDDFESRRSLNIGPLP